MHRDRLFVKHSKREDDPILFPNGEREREEKLPHVHHPAWMQVFPAQRRTSSVEETTATLWERMIYGQCSSMQLQFLLPFHRLRKVGFFSRSYLSLPFSPHLSTTKQPTRCPVHLLILSRGNLSRLFFLSSSYYWKLYLLAMFLSFSLSRYLSLSLSTHPPCWKDSSVDP